MANTILHFEIPADDVGRAKGFYEKVFGWKITQYPMPAGQEYWGISTRKDDKAPGINGGLMKRQMPTQPLTNYITVKDIDPMIAAVQANGAAMIVPKREIPGGMGWIAVFKDPENNVMGLHQSGPQAARPRAAAKKKPAKKSPKKSAKKPSRKRR